MTKETTAFKLMSFFLVALHGTVMAEAVVTLEEFLSATSLGQRSAVLEKSFGMDPGSLQDIRSYQPIAKLEYGGLDFTVQVFMGEGECKAFRIWCEQDQRLDRERRRLHKDKAEVDDVFEKLLGELAKRYGKAPTVVLPERLSESRRDDPTYTWVNDEYALMLAIWDSITSKSITLTHYRREETKGEWTDLDSREFFRNLHKNSAGKLPVGWPVGKTTAIKSQK